MLLFWSAFGLGLAFFATPGAITVLLLRRGLEQGFFSALFLQLGALIGVTLWAIIAFIGLAVFALNTTVPCDLRCDRRPVIAAAHMASVQSCLSRQGRRDERTGRDSQLTKSSDIPGWFSL